MEYLTINEKMIAEHKAKMNTIRAKYGNMTADVAYFALMSHELGELKQLVAKQTQLLSKLLENTPEAPAPETVLPKAVVKAEPKILNIDKPVEDFTTSLKK